MTSPDKTRKPRGRLPLPVLFASFAAMFSILLFPGLAADRTPSSRARELHKSYVESAFADLPAMLADFYDAQLSLIRIVPPDAPFCAQDRGARCFAAKKFPREFIRGLIPVSRGGYVVYPVTVFEDARTRDRVFVNAAGTEFYSVPAPPGYDPLWLLKACVPDYAGQNLSPDEFARLAWDYDPARVIARYELILKSDLDEYVAAIVAQEEPPDAPIIMSAYEGPPVDEMRFTDVERLSDAVRVTIAYPASFSNQIDIFSCDGGMGLMDFWWDLRVTTNSNPATNWIEWTDTDATNAIDGIRFYAAADGALDATTDPDDDGLTWGREKYLYHTCPTNSDTDGDFLGDYEEVINLDTDPNNADTNRPTAAISFPTDNFNWMWMP